MVDRWLGLIPLPISLKWGMDNRTRPMKHFLYYILVVLVLGCASERTVTTPPPEPAASVLTTPPRMTQAELKQVSTELATKEGYQLAQFQEPRFEWHPQQRFWTVWYVRKPPIVAGGYFSIRVHDSTGEAYFIHKE
jgi:hypothetical protein